MYSVRTHYSLLLLFFKRQQRHLIFSCLWALAVPVALAGDLFHGDSRPGLECIGPRPAGVTSIWELHFGEPAPDTECNPDGSAKAVFACQKVGYAVKFARLNTNLRGGHPCVYRLPDTGFVPVVIGLGHDKDPDWSGTMVHQGPNPVPVKSVYKLTNGPISQCMSRNFPMTMRFCDVMNIRIQCVSERVRLSMQRASIGVQYVSESVRSSMQCANAGVKCTLQSVRNSIRGLENVNPDPGLTGIMALTMAPGIASQGLDSLENGQGLQGAVELGAATTVGLMGTSLVAGTSAQVVGYGGSLAIAAGGLAAPAGAAIGGVAFLGYGASGCVANTPSNGYIPATYTPSGNWLIDSMKAYGANFSDLYLGTAEFAR